MTRIGIDLGGTKIEAVLIDSNQAVIKRERIATYQENGYQSIVERIGGLIKKLETHAEQDLAIGVCTPGAISKTSGRIKNSNTTCLIGKPLKEDLENEIGHSIKMENDANCFAVAEASMGAGKGYSTVFGVIMGTGVGGGIVIDGKVLQGRSNIAGEWGHHKIDPAGPRCYCGRNGCVETYISGPALERRWWELDGPERNLPGIVESVVKNPAKIPAQQWKREFLNNFGIALANVINILDPNAIILGGGVSNIPFLYTEGKQAVYHYVFSDSTDTPILKNQLGDSAGVFGSALL